MIHRMKLFTLKGVHLPCAPGKELVVKRYHQDLERIKRAHRTHLREVHSWPKKAVDCECELQAGRFRKKKALGCGRSRCLLCHYDKLMGIESAKDWIRKQQFEDSLEDYLDSIAEIREENAV